MFGKRFRKLFHISFGALEILLGKAARLIALTAGFYGIPLSDTHASPRLVIADEPSYSLSKYVRCYPCYSGQIICQGHGTEQEVSHE